MIRTARWRLFVAWALSATLVVVAQPALCVAGVADGDCTVQAMRPLPGVGPISDVLEGPEVPVHAEPGACGPIGWLAWVALLALPVCWRRNSGYRRVNTPGATALKQC